MASHSLVRRLTEYIVLRRVAAARNAQPTTWSIDHLLASRSTWYA